METEALPSVSIPHADKYVHFIEYFSFFTVWFMYLYLAFQKSFKHIFLIAFFSTVFFGIVIEVLQEELTTYRSFDWGDVLFNSLGALSSGILIFLFAHRIKKFKAINKTQIDN